MDPLLFLACLAAIVTMLITFSNSTNDMLLSKKDIGRLLDIHAPWELSEVTLAHQAR